MRDFLRGFFVVLAFVVSLIFIAHISLVLKAKTQAQDGRDCWPIAASQSTGTIRCWSGGNLIYQNSIYYNGDVLCAIDGHEIHITGGKSLCIIESNQGDIWNPPIGNEGALPE